MDATIEAQNSIQEQIMQKEREEREDYEATMED